jgi:glycosyltransferase involved in cell wall biosynthesis
LGSLLENDGHEVHFFGMKGNENLPCPDEKYFINKIDYRKAINAKNPINGLRVLWCSIYSFEAKKNISRLLDDIKPDIIHLHSIRHHLTKSILFEFAVRNIPVVWTLHDFKEICPNTSFYDGKTICEKCKGKKYRNIIWNKCKKGSLIASIITYFESKINNRAEYEKYVDLYISPSKFLRNKFIEYGYPPHKIINIPNFIELEEFNPHYEFENYLLFIGRLEKDKGLATMIKGFCRAKNFNSPLQLKIAGTGTIEKELKELACRMNISNIEFLGFQQGAALENLIKMAKGILIPSECYENYPYSGLEAMAYGKPIIASRIGGIPELVEHGITGFLFEPFNENDLAKQIDALNNLSKEKIGQMGRLARQKVEKVNSEEIYLPKIFNLYKTLLQNKQDKISLKNMAE